MELYSLNEAFYTQQMMNPMSSGQIALWHALVRIANKSHWPDWFTIAGITLVQLSGLSNAGVKKARNELKQRGMIDFKPDNGRATRYKLIDISKSSSVSSPVGSSVSSPVGSPVGSSVSSALRIQDNTKNTPTAPTGGNADGWTAYVADNLRGMTPGNWDELRSYLDDGLSGELICHAVDEAAANAKRSWSYVRRILNRYLTEGITTVEQAKQTDIRPANAEPSNGLNKWLVKGADAV